MIDYDYKAHDQQLKFLDLQSRYKAFIGGVGSGKTHVGCIYALNRALENPNTLGVCATRTYTMLRDVMIRTFFDVVSNDLIVDYNKQESKIELINGSEIIFRPLEREDRIDKLRGLTINWFWIDEAAYVPHYAFKLLKSRLRQGEERSGAITTTPKGFNWIYNVFVKNGGKENHESIRNVHSEQNPFLPGGYVEDLKQDYSQEYLRQEVFGEFVKFEGLVYKEYKDSIHKLPLGKTKKLDIEKYIYGYDAGYRNPRVLLKIAKTVNDRYIVLNEFYESNVTLSDFIRRIKESTLYEGGKIYADPSAKGEIEEMKKEGLKVEGADNEVSAGIQKVKSLIDSGDLQFSELCQNTLNEINSYRWKDNDNKDEPAKEKKDEPVKENDHAMDSLRYALYSDSRNKEAGVATISWTSNRNNNKRNKSRFSY